MFVEANDDQNFYSFILGKLEMLKFEFLKVPVSFQCLPSINPSRDTQIFSDMTHKKPSLVKELVNLIGGNHEINIDKEVNEFLDQIIQKKSQVNNETKQAVKQIVKKFISSPQVDTTTVTNLPNETFFGIVDGDDEINTIEAHIIYTEQYSFENYVLTPLTIFLLAKQLLKTDSLIKEILNETKLNENTNSIGDILELENGVEIIQKIFDKITNTLAEHINDKLEHYVNILNNRYVVIRKHDEIEKAFDFEQYYTDKKRSKPLKQTKLFTINSSGQTYIKLSLNSKLSAEKVEFIYSKTELFKLDIAKFMLKIKGKWLQQFYEELFPELKRELLKLAELKGRKETDGLCRLIIDYQIKLLKNNDDIILLPKEFKKSFQQIHEVNLKEDYDEFLITYAKTKQGHLGDNFQR